MLISDYPMFPPQIPTLVVLLVVNLMMVRHAQQMEQRYGLIIQWRALFCQLLILYHKTMIVYLLMLFWVRHMFLATLHNYSFGFLFRFQRIWVLKLSWMKRSKLVILLKEIVSIRSSFVLLCYLDVFSMIFSLKRMQISFPSNFCLLYVLYSLLTHGFLSFSV